MTEASDQHPDQPADTDLARFDFRGAQGAQVGDSNLQVNVFYREAAAVVWPVRVGAVPLLADCFQVRETVTTRLAAAAHEGTAVVTQVLSGLGGVGKTQLAAAFAEQAWTAGELDLLVWVTATSREGIEAGYAEAAHRVGQAPPIEADQAANWFLTWLQATPRRWLVVLDDLSDPANAQGMWPSGPAGRCVVTTRRRDAAMRRQGRRLIEVGLFTEQEALDYLSKKIDDSHRLAEASDLADDLGHLPLALAQAAAFIVDRNESCAGYRKRLRDRRASLHDVLPPDALADDYRSTVATTWSISIDLADQLPPAGIARPILELAALLDPNGVPIDVLTSRSARAYADKRRQLAPALADAETPDVTAQECRDATSNLNRLSLLTVDPMSGERAARTHALVQRATLERLSEIERAVLATTVADALQECWPPVESDTTVAQALRDNAITLINRAAGNLWHSNAHPILFRFGRSLGECGLVTAAIDYWTNLVAQSDQLLGPDHPDTLATRNNLATCRGQAGDTAGAIGEFERLLPNLLRVLGPDHPATLLVRNSLASRRGEAGDTAGAIAESEQLLTDRQRVLGPDHPATLTARRNLALWRGEAGDTAGAIGEFERLLPNLLRVLGPDHPDTLATRNYVATCRGKAGDTTTAIAEFEQLLTDRQRVLGPDHPDTLATRANLATCRGQAGDVTGAIAEFEQLLTDELRVLGSDHPATLTTRNNLAHWRGENGDTTTAIAAFEQLLTDRQRVLGSDHPETVTTRKNLAHWRGVA